MAKVLVVDDAGFVRRWCRNVLEAKGHDVSETEDGTKAVDMYLTLLPDVVLLDINMYPKDGLTVLRELRQLDPNARVLMLTSDGEIDVVVQARRLGAMDYVLKPCPSERLIASVERALG